MMMTMIDGFSFHNLLSISCSRHNYHFIIKYWVHSCDGFAWIVYFCPIGDRELDVSQESFSNVRSFLHIIHIPLQPTTFMLIVISHSIYCTFITQLVDCDHRQSFPYHRQKKAKWKAAFARCIQPQKKFNIDTGLHER